MFIIHSGLNDNVLRMKRLQICFTEGQVHCNVMIVSWSDGYIHACTRNTHPINIITIMVNLHFVLCRFFTVNLFHLVFYISFIIADLILHRKQWELTPRKAVIVSFAKKILYFVASTTSSHFRIWTIIILLTYKHECVCSKKTDKRLHNTDLSRVKHDNGFDTFKFKPCIHKLDLIYDCKIMSSYTMECLLLNTFCI